MKKNKYLKRIADDSTKELKNDEFKDRLLLELNKHKTENRRAESARLKPKLKVVVSSLICVVIIAILIPCVMFVQTKLENNSGNTSEKPSYSFSDVISESVELKEINKNIIGYKLSDSEYIRNIELYCDIKSGDKLYYKVIWENYDTFTSVTIYIVINEYCDFFDFSTFEEIYAAETLWSASTESEFFESDGLYYHKVYAKTQIEDVRVYVNNYDTVNSSEESGFSEIIEKILIRN